MSKAANCAHLVSEVHNSQWSAASACLLWWQCTPTATTCCITQQWLQAVDSQTAAVNSQVVSAAAAAAGPVLCTVYALLSHGKNPCTHGAAQTTGGPKLQLYIYRLAKTLYDVIKQQSETNPPHCMHTALTMQPWLQCQLRLTRGCKEAVNRWRRGCKHCSKWPQDDFDTCTCSCWLTHSSRVCQLTAHHCCAGSCPVVPPYRSRLSADR